MANGPSGVRSPVLVSSLLLGACTLLGACSSGSSSTPATQGCVTIRDGDRHFEINNLLSTGLLVSLDAIPFAAFVDPGCTRIGISIGTEIEIRFQQATKQSDGSYKPFGPVKSRKTSLPDGALGEWFIRDSFFTSPAVLAGDGSVLHGDYEGSVIVDRDGEESLERVSLRLFGDPATPSVLEGELLNESGELFEMRGSTEGEVATLRGGADASGVDTVQLRVGRGEEGCWIEVDGLGASRFTMRGNLTIVELHLEEHAALSDR